MENLLVNGNSLEVLKDLPDDSVGLVCQDPPYLLGFMNRKWDKATEENKKEIQEIFNETFRVMKPGTFIFSFCHSRQDSIITLGSMLSEAGFNINFPSIYWLYLSAFPKSYNISKGIDRRLNSLNTKDYLLFSKEKPEVNKYDESGRWVVDYKKGTTIADNDMLNLGYENSKDYGGFAKGAAGVKQKNCWIPIYGNRVVGKSLHNKSSERFYGNCKEPFAPAAGEDNFWDITEPSSPASKNLEGSYAGYAPKICTEVVLVGMKPLSEKSYIDQALANGRGITWLHAGRIPYAKDPEDYPNIGNRHKHNRGEGYGFEPAWENKGGVKWGEHEWKEIEQQQAHLKGRFAPNVLVEDDALNNGQKLNQGHHPQTKTTGYGEFGGGKNEYYGTGTKIRVSQSGLGRGELDKYDGRTKMPEIKEGHKMVRNISDPGSLSKYFDLDRWWEEKIKELPESVQETLPFIYCPKASKKEKEAGLEDLEGKRKNTHVAVKPIKLLSYLITIGSREGDLVLDPFMGSGSCGVAAKMLNRDYIGIEKEEEYYDISVGRVFCSPAAKKGEKDD